MNEPSPNKKNSPAMHGARRRSAARLAACQALYEMDISETSADTALRGFFPNSWNIVESEEGEVRLSVLAEPDGDHLCDLVRGVSSHKAAIDPMIEASLSEPWTLDRLESLLRSILRAGAYELLAIKDVPPRVVINEYLEVTRAFFSGNEISLVNNVLDQLAHTLRADAFKSADNEPTDKTD